MMTREQASAIWKANPPLAWPDRTPIGHAEPIDYGTFWHLPYKDGTVGSLGLLLDKADGHMNWLGSSLALETWIYAHRCGFSHKRYILHILAIHNPDKLVTLLRKLRYTLLDWDLNALPLQLSFSWMGFEKLEDIARADWIDYEFTISECDWPSCSNIGATIPSFKDVPVKIPPPPAFER